MKLIVRIANALLYRYDVPVRQHPPGHVGCIVCGAYAHGFYDAAEIAQRGTAEDEWRRFLRAYEMPVQS